MKWFQTLFPILCALAAPIQAQNSSALLQSAMQRLPKCAIDCLLTSVTQSSCELTDFFCIAHNEQLNAQMEACVQAKCTIRESLTTKNFTVSAYGLPERDHTKLVSYSGLIGGSIALLTVILRVFARMPCCGGTWGLDDWAILVTMIPMVPLTALSYILAEDGLGRDMWLVPFEKITKILHIYYYDELLYLSSIALTKISILLFYLRIFPNPTFRKMSWTAIAYCVGYILGTCLALVFQCKPLNLAWTRWDNEHPGKCINLNLLGWMAAALNILGDVIVISLPLHELSKLALGKQKKAGIMLMFLGGSFVTVVSMLRLKYMIQFATTRNVTWDYTPIGYWSTLEVHVGVIIACLPAVRSLQRRMFPGPKQPNSYYLGNSGAGYNSKGGSPFPSMAKGSQANMGSSRDRSRTDKEFIQLQEYEYPVGDQTSSIEKGVDHHHHHSASCSSPIDRTSTHTDDDAVLLPIQSPPQSRCQNTGRLPDASQLITVRKDISVTVSDFNSLRGSEVGGSQAGRMGTRY